MQLSEEFSYKGHLIQMYRDEKPVCGARKGHVYAWRAFIDNQDSTAALVIPGRMHRWKEMARELIDSWTRNSNTLNPGGMSAH